ncbi:MAG: hypothetical protein WD872_18265 [Pirellulaceae bacterium]
MADHAAMESRAQISRRIKARIPIHDSRVALDYDHGWNVLRFVCHDRANRSTIDFPLQSQFLPRKNTGRDRDCCDRSTVDRNLRFRGGNSRLPIQYAVLALAPYVDHRWLIDRYLGEPLLQSVLVSGIAPLSRYGWTVNVLGCRNGGRRRDHWRLVPRFLQKMSRCFLVSARLVPNRDRRFDRTNSRP